MEPVGKVPQRYLGPVSVEAAGQGIAALEANAARLARDAKLLFQARRYPSAAMLAAMALVEVSRISALLALPGARDEVQRRDAWRRFHEAAPDFPWSVCHGGRTAMSDAATNEMLEVIGAIGERVECLAPGTWTRPEQAIGRDLAGALVEMAELFRAHPVDHEPLRLWMQVIQSSAEGLDDRELFERYRHALEARGLTDVAAAVPGG